jgi:uncharacterized membrane protein YgcG
MARRPARTLGPRHALLAVVAWTLLALLTLAPVALAAGPPFGDRPEGTGSHLIDDAGVLTRQAEAALDQSLQALQDATGTDVVVYLQTKPAARNQAAAQADAQALLDEWAVGGAEGDGVVLLLDLDRQGTRASTAIAAGAAVLERVGQPALDSIVRDTMAGSLGEAAWLAAVTQGVVAVSAQLGGAPAGTPGPAVTPGPVVTPEPGATPAPQATPGATFDPSLVPDLGETPPAGPPWPEPIPGNRVYDFADVLEDETVVGVNQTIRRIEDRTGAQVVVYTQVKPSSAGSESAAEADARSLMDTWGVGRRGFDDGLVILFDLDESRCHGQVQLYAGPGYRASFLTNEDRQQVFERDMLPNLQNDLCDFDSALLAAMATIDANATPERANALQTARQIDAATGLVLAPILALGLLAWAGWSWLRYGKDPEYLEDPSMLMPAPPPGLSPAAAAVVLDGRATRHALTTAMVDLAARGELRFREAAPDEGGKLAIEVLTPETGDPRVARNRREPIGPAETWALERLQGLAGGDGWIEPTRLLDFGKHEEGFQDRLEQHVTEQGWYPETPERSTDRWTFRAAVVLVAGIAGTVLGWIVPSNGLLLVGAGLVIASIGMFILARAMPQRTMQGAMVNAWLASYRRTLSKQLEQSRTMDQVVESHAVPWLETPDQAVVWGYALGLHEEVEDVLARTVEVAGTRAGVGAYMPAWYLAASTTDGSGGGGGTFGSSGMFSSSSLPNFGAMGAALATIGASASSSGSGGSSGGFGGGGSGGGGGGAGGGF